MNKKELLSSITKSFLTGTFFVIGGIVTIFGVIAFESMGTTPEDSGNQSLGSQILSKLSSGGFDRTTDSLEALSDKISAVETDINTVETKVDGLGGGVTWAGYTSSSYNGNMGYSKGMLDKCNTEYSGSKPMTYQDWLNLGLNYPNTDNVWLIDGSYTDGCQTTKDGYSNSCTGGRYIMCNGWAVDNSSYLGPYIHTTGRISLATCNNSYKIPCVYK